MKKYFILLLLFCFCLFAAEIPVDLNHSIYQFISRMENRNIIQLNTSSYPYSRNKIAKILLQIEKNQNNLSETEIELFKEYIVDFRLEMQGSHHENLRIHDNGLLAPVFTNNGITRIAKNILSRENEFEASHLFTYEKDDFFIWGDGGFRFENQWKNNNSRMLMSDRYLVQGGLNKNIFFHVKFFRYMRKNNPDFNDLTQEELGNWSMSQPKGDITFDNVYSSVAYNKNNITIGLYHQPLVWGTSAQNSLILSGTGAPFSYLGFDYEYKGINFSFIHGSLLNDSTNVRNADFEIRNQEKYIVGHRIDIPLFNGTTRIGLSEMVIYGNRNVEPGYLMPVNFYWSIEHSLMNRDNSLLALDFQTNIIQNFKFYGSLLLDELRFSELFGKWWANKHGFQFGTKYSNELFSIPMNWSGEITLLRPWTYSHKFFINNYTNNGISLGFPYSGNSQFAEFENESWLNRRTKISMKYTYLKHGYDKDDEFFGGDPTISYEKRNPKFDNDTQWLMGVIRVIDYFTFDIQYEIYNDAYLNFELIKYLSEPQDLFINMGFNLDF